LTKVKEARLSLYIGLNPLLQRRWFSSIYAASCHIGE